MIAGVAACLMALIPGMPKIPFLLVGGIADLRRRCGIKRAEDGADEGRGARRGRRAQQAPSSDTPEELMEQMRVHALEVQLSPDLVDLVSGVSDDLLARVKALRRRIAMEYGVVVPPVRTRDSVDLPPSTYVIRVAGVEMGRGIAPVGKVLALGDHLDALPGTPTIEPVFQLAGKWIPAELRHAAETTGATVIDRGSVLVTHLSSVITDNAGRLLSREDVRVLTEGVKRHQPGARGGADPRTSSPSPRCTGCCRGCSPSGCRSTTSPASTRRCRCARRCRPTRRGSSRPRAARSGRCSSPPHLDERTLRVVMIDPHLEQSMLENLRPSEVGHADPDDPRPDRADRRVPPQRRADRRRCAGWSPVLVCAPALRPAVRRLVAPQTNGLPVLSYQEVTSADVIIETVGVVRALDTISA